VYFTYGMHFCMNVVTGDDGEGSAVLLRAAEPLEGVGRMAEHRGLADPRLLCAGPGRLCQALSVGREQNGADLVRGAGLRIERGVEVPPDRMLAGPRVGISVARDRPWRFVVAGSRFLSKGPRAG
jgi:DNA-3-methyladenine glycosylase